MKNEEVKQPDKVEEIKQEEDLILETGEEWEEEEYFLDYSETIATCYNALSAIEMINPLTDKDTKRVNQIKSQCLYLIHRSVSELVKEFDTAHE
jgi:hypothetical protein